MLILGKKLSELTGGEAIGVIGELVQSGYVMEFAPTVKQPNEKVDCVLEMVDHLLDTEITDAALHFNVIATKLGTTCPNGFDEWSFKGIDSNMRRWYNEFYCGGSPESHNGYEFDVLGIG